METSTQSRELIETAIKKGLLLGVFHIILFSLIYLFFSNKLTGLSYLSIILVINLGYGIYEGIQYRKSQGGYLNFGQAFLYAFILLAANGLLFTVFSIAFLFVDPTLPEQMAQNQLDTSIYWAEKLGAPVDTIDQIEDDFNKEDIIKDYDIAGLVKGYGLALILYAIGGLIIALFVKKNQPEVF